jgi:putative resolvase
MPIQHSDAATEEWIAPGEASDLLGVSPKTLTRMADVGEVRSRRLPSGHRRYLRSSVEALAEAGERAS